MPLTQGTAEVCNAISRQTSKERAQLLTRDWWLASDRSPEDVRAVLACKVWGGEPCRVVAPEIWVAIWRRAGFVNIGKHPRPTERTRVFRAAEPAVLRALSWTPDRGYAEFWRAAAKAPTLDASAERARGILAGNARERPSLSATGATMHTYSAWASPEAVLAVLEHRGGVVEWVVDPEMLTDVQKVKPDLEAARAFAENCQRNVDQFPRIATDAEGHVYVRRPDGYHQLVPTAAFPDPRVFLDPEVARAHGLLSDDDSAITYV